MKIFRFLAIGLIGLFVVASANQAVAQTKQNPNNTTEKQQKPQFEKKKNYNEKVKSMKIAFFTEKLNLTEEEAEKFWPVYNSCEREAFQARKETMDAQMELVKAIKGEPVKSEAEIKALADKYYSCIEQENVVAKANYIKYQKVLPTQKAVMVRILEESFLRNLVGQMKHSATNNPKDQPNTKKGEKPQRPTQK